MQDVLGYWKDVRGKFLAEPLGEQGLEARTIYLQKELCQSAHPILLGHKNFWPLTCPKEGSPLLRFLQTPESSKGKLFTALGQPNPQMPCHRIQSRIGQGSPLAHSNDQAKRNSQMKNDKENEKKKHTLLPLHYFRFIYVVVSTQLKIMLLKLDHFPRYSSPPKWFSVFTDGPTRVAYFQVISQLEACGLRGPRLPIDAHHLKGKWKQRAKQRKI